MSEIARTGYVILGRQAAKGTASPSLIHGLRVTSNSLSGQTDRVDDDDEIGGGRDYDVSGALNAGFSVGGSLEGLMRPRAFGLLLLGAGFTAPAPVQDAATGAFTHTFVPATPSYLTVESRWGTTAAIRRFVDCLVDTLTVSLDAGGKATWSADLIGRDESWLATPSTPTFETDPVASWDGSAVTLDGLGTYRFESVELSIANNLADDEWVIGSRKLDDVTPGTREVTFSGTIKVGDNSPAVTDLYRAAVYGSKTATAPAGSDPYQTSAAVTFGSTRKVGTSTTVFGGATFTIPTMTLTGFPLEASGSDRLAVDIEGRGYKGASDVVTPVLRNTFATAYSAA